MNLLPAIPIVALLAVAAHASPLPQLNDPAPPAVVAAHGTGRHARICATGGDHHDPCADIHVHRERITVAWDAKTHKVTYLYSTTIETDTELVTGGLGRIDASLPITRFAAGFISSEWCDTDTDLSGDALWCAIMKPADRHYGKVIGFVQSIYLDLPPDPDDLPSVIKTHGRARGSRRSPAPQAGQ